MRVERSILDSVPSSRSIPSKQILVLAQPSSVQINSCATQGAVVPKELISLLVTMFTDVRDEAYEGKYSRLQVTSNSMLRVLDSLARLSVCTVPSSESSHTALLPHFLSPRSSLLHTLIIIVLDWTRPSTFVEELQTWLTWGRNVVKGRRISRARNYP